MKRMKVLFGQRRLQVLLTLAVLLLAVSVVIGSGANFTATSANAGNAFTAGNLSMNNDVPGAIFLTTPARMRPGATSTGTVTISNTGDVPGQFSLTKTATSDPNDLGARLDLLIKEGSTTIYTGKLNAAMGTLDLLTWQTTGATASHTYTFTVTWTNNTPSGDAADTALMGKTCTYRFDWTAIANSTIN
jgi:spore coat-associated protein N